MNREPLWTPSPERVARSSIVVFARQLAQRGLCDAVREVGGATALDYEALYRFSIENAEEFWRALWRFSGVDADVEGEVRDGAPVDVVVGLGRMAPPDPVRGPRWFPGTRLNFAEHLLRFGGAKPALVSWTESGSRGSVSRDELREAVSRVAAALRAEGVEPGDRVVAFMPNAIETVVAMLGTSSIGGLWSSCSPDFGARGVVDRFGQIGPRILFCADGYRYGGREIDSLERVREIAAAIPGIERVVVVPFLGGGVDLEGIRGAVWWSDWLGERGAPPGKEDRHRLSSDRHASPFVRLPFDHPLFIMYSSGTTGLPKCMVHGAGGTLLQHLKEHLLHTDLSADDSVFYFTTCGWMMWNWLVSALAVGATVVLYDGAPMAPSTDRGDRDLLWQMAEAERITVFGTSARYLALSEKEGLAPARARDLTPLRTILSTGSPLAPSSFDWVYREVGSDVQLSSISGGTDIISCFALGNPAGPVWRGELQARGLGMRVEVFGEDGAPIARGQGELACTMPFPSMPVAFWNDPGGAKYRAAYFERFPGVWRHGDWAELTPHGGLIISGRSDATLNPGGVRIGTAEIYRQVEQLPEVLESVVVGQESGEGADRDVRIVLFVRLGDGLQLDDELRGRIRSRIREHASPHHVPRVIVQVPDIPRTISGKITELAVREAIHGRSVGNTDALANPSSLDFFRRVQLPPT